MNGRVVLVTGGAGYIGSHACKALSRAGYLPVTFDNLVHGHEWAVKWGPLERGDILDRPRLDAAIAKHRPGAILHFAAFAYVGESSIDPGKYYRNNVTGSLNLLEAARDAGIANFVLSSTCATYGAPVRLPITEDTPQRPINPYGASKLMAERMLADFGAAHGLRYIVLRYFNAAGADPDCEIGEDHDPETHLIPFVLDAAPAGVRTLRCSAPTTTPRTAPACATTSMSRTWRVRTSWRSRRWSAELRPMPTTWEMDEASRFWRSFGLSSARPASRYRSSVGHAAPATPPPS
jgi:UDP-glucose-4-epimerase GalE